jgi:hypothetical protein
MARTCLTVVALLAVTACGDNLGAPIPDAGTEPAIPQGSEPTSELIINEVSPRGAGDDWIEIANRSAASIDLCDYFLSDSVDRLDHYLPLGGAAPPDLCEPLLIDGGAYLVITADGGDGAPFRLGVADEVHLIRVDGEPVDSLIYLYRAATPGDTLARLPDASGLFFPAAPTPGEANR